MKQALTHSSYAHERRINKVECNERLEFLGDAVLELISSKYLFARYPRMPEGDLSRLRASLVCEPALAECAQRLGLGSLLYLGKGEEAGGGREKASVTSDACEALIGAIFLDGGMEEAARFVERELLKDSDAHVREKDPKTALQEMIQAGGGGSVEYRLLREEGPEHDKRFYVEVSIRGEACGEGVGKNKKSAEKDAAAKALKYLERKA
ncbi:MAG: ribonuclease III [Lachnospiraceae bacterium]|nr:ribonuclease III [Lachnospiraceae bacterium]